MNVKDQNLVLLISPKRGQVSLIPELLKAFAKQIENDLVSGTLDDNCTAVNFSAEGGIEWEFVDTDIDSLAAFLDLRPCTCCTGVENN